MYFSQQFKITKVAEDDWFDPILDTDTKLFVDPFLIFRDPDKYWRQAHRDLIKHFNRCFSLIAKGGRDRKTVPYQKAVALLHFPEPREYCLGYTETGTRGSGGGLVYAQLIASAMEGAILRGLKDLRHFEELGVLNEGIGPDRISDLTCNVLRSYFIDYTLEVVRRHQLPTSNVRLGGARFDTQRVAWASDWFDLSINPVTHQPVLLTPKRFLRDLPILNADDWWDNYEAQQLRNDVNYDVMKRVSKKQIVAAARQDPESVRDWARAKEGAAATPYDFEKDRKGVWVWAGVTAAYADARPLSLPLPSDEESFIGVIDLIVTEFKHFVEQGGGWKLLWNDGNTKEKPEEASQLVFKGIAQSYCKANNIVLDREVNLGRGPVDFKFSNGYTRRAVLEVKKLHNTKFWNGLQEQLPSYLVSDQGDLGWFVVMHLRQAGRGGAHRWRDDGPSVLRKVAAASGLRLKAVTVDGRPAPSASEL